MTDQPETIDVGCVRCGWTTTAAFGPDAVRAAREHGPECPNPPQAGEELFA